MVEIKKDISNKTNMHSINASIEASKASEAGKGFSVVASEIRELSKETLFSAKKVGDAGKQIQEKIENNSLDISNQITFILSVIDTIQKAIDLLPKKVIK
jgi:methyl-accepting chemotaxis protein